jgi:cell division protein FtsQ
VIHPRIRARRVAVARDVGRRRLRRLVLALAVTTVVGLATAVVLSPILDVDQVVVVGAGARAADVRAAAGVERGSPLLLVATGAVEERVEALAWVGHAEVRRELPGALRIDVRRRPPVAVVVRPDGAVALIDATGSVTGVTRQWPGGFPVLVTSRPSPEPGQRVRPAAAARVAGALGPLAGSVARVSVEGGRATLLLTDGIEVRLGGLERLREKSRAAHAVLGARSVAPVAYVDVRVPAAPVTG